MKREERKEEGKSGRRRGWPAGVGRGAARPFGAAALSSVLALVLAAALPSPASGVVEVITTTTQVTDLVRDVGGAQVVVVGLMGPGVDPHLYKPTASDVAKLRRAQVIFYSGLMLEGRMADIFFKMARRGAKVYAVTENAPKNLLLEPEAFEGHWDPHVWFDPEIWLTAVDVVVEALGDADRANAALYARRGADLKKRYREVFAWGVQRMAEVPKARRILVTSHDAFNYFGRAFGLQVVAVQGISTQTEAGLKDVANTIDFIKANKVKAIFVESSVSPAAIERISKDSGARIGGELFSDAMGEPGKFETGPGGERYDVGTWVGMMKHNVNTVVEALK